MLCDGWALSGYYVPPQPELHLVGVRAGFGQLLNKYEKFENVHNKFCLLKEYVKDI